MLWFLQSQDVPHKSMATQQHRCSLPTFQFNSSLSLLPSTPCNSCTIWLLLKNISQRPPEVSWVLYHPYNLQEAIITVKVFFSCCFGQFDSLRFLPGNDWQNRFPITSARRAQTGRWKQKRIENDLNQDFSYSDEPLTTNAMHLSFSC